MSPKALWVLLIAWAAIAFKTLFGDLALGRFDYHKHGYDFCIITLGSSMASLGMQIVSDEDLFSGLPSMFPMGLIEKLAPGDYFSQRVILLLLIFFASSILALLAAGNSRSILNETAKNTWSLSLLNFILGTGIFGFYIFLLIARV